jgi:hypothetical protein
MLQMAPRVPIPPSRLPPVPYPAKRRGLSQLDRDIIKIALVAGPPMLPTDVPDLDPLIEELEGTVVEESAA